MSAGPPWDCEFYVYLCGPGQMEWQRREWCGSITGSQQEREVLGPRLEKGFTGRINAMQG